MPNLPSHPGAPKLSILKGPWSEIARKILQAVSFTDTTDPRPETHQNTGPKIDAPTMINWREDRKRDSS